MRYNIMSKGVDGKSSFKRFATESRAYAESAVQMLSAKNLSEPLPEKAKNALLGADVLRHVTADRYYIVPKKRIAKGGGQSGWYHGTCTASSLFIYRGRGFFIFSMLIIFMEVSR